MYIKLFKREEKQRHFPVAEGDAVEIFRLLAMWGTADQYVVYDGEKYENAREFIVRMGGSVRPADSSMTVEERMRIDDLFDPIIHARNHMVEQLIARAIRISHEPDYMPDLLAKSTAFDVISLFY